jgi:chromosome partitioning protein
MTMILSVMGRKGGITKTTVATNLAAACAGAGLFTVLVEMDGQGNASEAMGIKPRDDFHDLMLGNCEWSDVLQPALTTFTDGELFALSASDLTREVEENPNTPSMIYERLKLLRGWADVVIVDTSPGITQVHAGCYYASDYVLLPTLCELDSVNSVSKTLGFLKTANEAGAAAGYPAAEVLGIIPNRYPSGERNAQFLLGVVQGRFGHEYPILGPIRDATVWASARRTEHSIFTYQGANYAERRSINVARKDFEQVAQVVIAKVKAEAA